VAGSFSRVVPRSALAGTPSGIPNPASPRLNSPLLLDQAVVVAMVISSAFPVEPEKLDFPAAGPCARVAGRVYGGFHQPLPTENSSNWRHFH
jgi:hypothetical protein